VSESVTFVDIFNIYWSLYVVCVSVLLFMSAPNRRNAHRREAMSGGVDSEAVPDPYI